MESLKKVYDIMVVSIIKVFIFEIKLTMPKGLFLTVHKFLYDLIFTATDLKVRIEVFSFIVETKLRP